jgi:endonuclease/exonuclease/phosphatase family metal-dependent hydrolase
MKKKNFKQVFTPVFLLFLLPAFLNVNNINGQEISLKAMTFNIRLNTPDDGINRWDNRKQIAAGAIIDQDIDFAGMQEVLDGQMKDLVSLLPGYGHIGVGREDGKSKGEAVPIFYKLSRFELIENVTFWLSATPNDTASVGWDAALTRICTWGKFKDKSSGKQFYYLNTHFDHMGKTARAESARLILNFIMKNTGNLPAILSGDFNCTPADEPYLVLTNPNIGLTDACHLNKTFKDCDEGTFNGFASQTEPEKIDMFFVKGRWEASSYDVLKIKKDDVFISDHWPVVTELKLNPR